MSGKRFWSCAFSASVRWTSIFSGRSVVEILRLKVLSVFCIEVIGNIDGCFANGAL